MPKFTVTLDTRKFEAAVKFVFNNTRRALPEIINRAALVTIIGGKGVEGVMKRTPRALVGTIKGVPDAAIAAYLRAKHIVPSKEAIKKERKRRIAAIGYTAVTGWAKAANDLGGHSRLRAGKGYATMGFAVPATAGNYSATIANTTPAAILIGQAPLQDALDATADDMIQYWQQQTGVIFHP